MEYLFQLNEFFKRSRFDKISSILQKDCGQFLDLLRKWNIEGLYRGFKNPRGVVTNGLYKIDVTERTSRDMKRVVSDVFDSGFENKFNIPLRKKGVFVTKSFSVATDYSPLENVYLFFPIGNFRYFWNPQVDDLFIKVRDRWWYEKDPFFWDRGVRNEINDICNGYKEGGIEDVRYHEITFICDSYFLLDIDYFQEFQNFLK
jgi:hypothetical protein